MKPLGLKNISVQDHFQPDKENDDRTRNRKRINIDPDQLKDTVSYKKENDHNHSRSERCLPCIDVPYF